ncbi:MAG: DoxX family protein [Pseudolabrys sp.]|nr:DoxX family protein [Pseudolabrys sp.]
MNTNTQNSDYAATLLRVTLGSIFLAHGLWKVLTLGLPVTVGFFESVGFPGWTAYLVVAGEIGGGVLLILGVQTRAISLLMLPILLGALKVHLPNGFVFSYPNGGWEYPAFLIVASGVQALLGDGAYALSRVFGGNARLATAHS